MLDFFKIKKSDSGQRMVRGSSMEADLPVREIRFVVLDTELTGLDRKQDAIVSIGAVKMAGGRIEMGRTFYRLVNPRREMKAESVVIHEITPSEILEKPSIDPVLSEFLEFCGGDVLIGHCLSIDLNFINRELKRILGKALNNPALDTLALVDWLRWNHSGPGGEPFPAKNFELCEIAKGLGIPVQGAHNALMDAFMTAQVFQRLLPRLEGAGIRTLEALLRVGSPERRIKTRGTVL